MTQTGDNANTIATNTLRILHKRLAAELRKSEKNSDQVRELLQQIEAVLGMLDPESSMAKLAASRKRSRVMTFKRGEPVQLTFQILRAATEPLTIREISERMAKLRGKDVADERGMYHLRHAIRHILKSHRGKSVTASEGIWPERWSIIPQ